MRTAAQLVEQAIDRDFVALLMAQNRAGAALPVAVVLHANAIPQQFYDNLVKDPTFETLVQRHTKELVESGFGMEQKAAVLYEMSLPLAYDIARDTEQPGQTRIKAMEFLGDASGRRDKRASLQVDARGNGFQLIINLGDDPKDKETFEGVAEVVVESTDHVEPTKSPQITHTPTPDDERDRLLSTFNTLAASEEELAEAEAYAEEY